MERRNALRADMLRVEQEFRNDEMQLVEEQTACKSCEVLKLELAKAHDEYRELFSHLTKKPEPEPKPDMENMKPITPNRHLSFAVRKQMLEAEDRAKARILRANEEANKVPVKMQGQSESASTEVDSDLTNQLELDLDIASQEREAQSGIRKEAVNGNESGSIA